MKELEKKQKEDEENQANHNSIYPGKEVTTILDLKSNLYFLQNVLVCANQRP